MKLSIVIICWNDFKVIKDCLASIHRETRDLEYEVIVSDNASADGSIEYVKQHFPDVRIVSNGANVGFAKGNNAGIRTARGEYVLILNPDTIVQERAFEKLVAFADRHPEAGAFGCRVLNPDGSFQNPARPAPTVFRYLLSALCLGWMGKIADVFNGNLYYGWDGRTERSVGYQCGCCILFRRALLEHLGGFDECFFYHFEESDLCRRVWDSGLSVLFYPGAEITHLGGQSVGRFPIRFNLETYRSQYRYFYKHFGVHGLRRIRKVTLLNIWLRRIGYGMVRLFKPSEALDNRLAMYRVALEWNGRLDPIRFIESGQEPDLGYEPLAPAPQMINRRGQ